MHLGGLPGLLSVLHAASTVNTAAASDSVNLAVDGVRPVVQRRPWDVGTQMFISCMRRLRGL